MGIRERPVQDREFKRVISHLGFEAQPRTGTSHEKWKHADGRMVIVDEHHSPYHRRLLAAMLHQACIGKREFFELLDRV